MMSSINPVKDVNRLQVKHSQKYNLRVTPHKHSVRRKFDRSDFRIQKQFLQRIKFSRSYVANHASREAGIETAPVALNWSQ